MKISCYFSLEYVSLTPIPCLFLPVVKECSVGGERGYTLVAGVDSSSRVTMLSGDKIGDVPTKYYVTGGYLVVGGLGGTSRPI